MKLHQIVPLISMLFASIAGSAQTAPLSDTLHINTVKAGFQSNGAFFKGGENGMFLVPGATNSNTSLSLIKSAGLWLAGKDPNGVIRLSAQVENEGGKTDFYPGLINDSGAPDHNFNLIAGVTRAEIDAHIANPFPPSAPMRAWPGLGNPYFFDFHGFEMPDNHPGGLASYYDKFFDGRYHPDEGDYPATGLRGCPQRFNVTASKWFVFNDLGPHTQSGGAPLHQEIQTEIFAYDCTEGSAANRMVYVIYKLINRDTVPLDSCYFGVYVDFEIGNGDDDFIGCNTTRRFVYAYNGDPVDEGGFEQTPPVVGIDLLRGPFNPDTGEEVSAWHFVPVDDSELNNPRNYFNLLRGKKANGSALPNNGLMYNGDPLVPSAWSELSAGNTPGDRKAVASFGPFTLLPGAVNELVLGYFWVRKNPNGSVTDNLGALVENDKQVQSLFDNCFELWQGCPPNVPTNNVASVAEPRVSPNPFQDQISVESPGNPMRSVLLFNALGQMVAERETAASEAIQLPTGKLPGGLYWLYVRLENGAIYSTKVLKQ
jgi:hypothetical protein